MTALSWLKLSEIPDGARVVFVDDYDIFPDCLVPAGTVCTIQENSLNEMQPGIILAPKDEKVRAALRAWDCMIIISPDVDSGDVEDPEWQQPSPLASQTAG